MKAFWTYTLARLGVFAATYVVLAAAVFGLGMMEFSELTNLLVLLAALVVSAIVSLITLGALREALALDVQRRSERAAKRIEESRSAEDID